jgi:uncharacterized iron-regulated protein
MRNLLATFALIITFITNSSVALAELNAPKAIYDSANERYISYVDLLNALPVEGNIVLGEYHYNAEIHRAQGFIIHDMAVHHRLLGGVSVSWEFLNYVDQELTQDAFSRFLNNSIDGEQLLAELFQSEDRGAQHAPYLPMINAVRVVGGEFIGVNAKRSVKRQLRLYGLDSLDPELVPPNMALGNDDYFQRFSDVMGGHVSDDELDGYFAAQSYTDCVMADQIVRQSRHPLRFLVVGSFHSDYNDGVVAELAKLSPLPTASVKLVDINGMSDEEVEQLLAPHDAYGPLADFIILL